MAPNPSLKSASHHVNGEAKLVRKHQQDDEGFLSAMQMVSSTVLSMAMQSAVELGVFDVMAKAGEDAKLSAKEIANKISSKNPEASIMLDRILRLLASHSVVDCSLVDDKAGKGSVEIIRLYSLTPMSRYFVTDVDGVSLGPGMVLIQDKIFLESW